MRSFEATRNAIYHRLKMENVYNDRLEHLVWDMVIQELEVERRKVESECKQPIY